MTDPKPLLQLRPLAPLIAPLIAALLAMPAHAATYTCVTKAMRGNKWICKDDPDVCTFVFTVNEKTKVMTRRVSDEEPRVPVTVDKWEDNKIIAHEDRNRIDSRFIEQYYYKIGLENGDFLMANEYMTNSGRYLTQEELNAADPKKYARWFKPRLFTETGSCRFKGRN